MQDLHQYGGVPAVMKYMLAQGWLHGDCLTVTGKTIAENLAAAPDLDFHQQKIILPKENPIKATGHLQIMYGNLATGGSVAKISGKEGDLFEGPARVFDGEQSLIEGINTGKIKEGDLVFFKTDGKKVSHVGVTITSDYFIHASSKKGVVINSLSEPYYSKRFVSFGSYR
jgi:dihydroxy-acid dehydratase